MRLGSLVLVGVLSNLAAACVSPTSDDGIGSSGDAVTGAAPNDASRPARITQAVVRDDAAFDAIQEVVALDRTGEQIFVCHAFLDGTDEQRRACDGYPTGYVRATCSDDLTNVGQTPRGTRCLDNRFFGRAPYDKGKGSYRVTFVSARDPSVRATQDVRLPSDLFQLFVSPRRPVYAIGSPSMPRGVAPNEIFALRVPNELLLEVVVRSTLVSSLKGCVGAYSTDGLSEAQIAERDRVELAKCAEPDVALEGRDGWSRHEGRFGGGRSSLQFDATPFLAPKLRLVFAFAIEGRVRSYVFQN